MKIDIKNIVDNERTDNVSRDVLQQASRIDKVDEKPEMILPDNTSDSTSGESVAVSLKQYTWLFGLIAALALLLGVTFFYTSMVPREVHAMINGEEQKIITKAYTIDELLEEENISFCDEDFISMPLTTYIYDGIEFELVQAADFTVTADGKTGEYKSLCDTVGEALEDCGIKVGKVDIVTPARKDELIDGMDIVVKRVVFKKETVKEDIPFKTIEKEDDSVNEGEKKVSRKGKKGKAEVTYKIKYIDGKEASRKKLSSKTIKPAVDKIISIGTRINYNGNTYSRKLVVKAYSYTGGGRTAMGTPARVGEIAVDPSVIPLGSNVYIEGVGPRRAEDTGGNIKGNTIDIYMNTQSECIRWGVRYVTVYIE